MRPEVRALVRRPGVIAAVVVVLFTSLLVRELWTGKDDRGPSARLSLDAWYYHAYLPSILEDHDLDFANEYHLTANRHDVRVVRRTGRIGNPFGVGPALYSAPFFVLGRIVEPDSDDQRGFGKTLVKWTLLASPVLTGLSLIFVARLLMRRCGGTVAPLVAGMTAILSGPLFYYAVRQPGYSHASAALFSAWLLDAWDASYDRPRTLRTWLGLGALFGATVLARPQLAMWGVVLAAAAVDDLRRGVSWRRLAPRLLAAAALALLVFSPQLIVWKILYGRFWVLPQGRGFMVWVAPRWSEVLFSTRNGWFAWTPVQAVGILGLLLSLRRTPRLSGILLLGVVLQVWTNGAVWDWWGGTSFGGRRFDSCLLAVAYGLGFLFSLRWRVVSALVAALVLVCTWANMRFALESNVWSLMPPGGRPVRAVMNEKVEGWPIDLAATMSEVMCLPARALFAWRHGTTLDAYDYVVGPHVLTEAYPGSGGAPRLKQRLVLRGDEKSLSGFEVSPMGARLVGTRGRVLVGINKRHGPVSLAVRTRTPAEMRIWFNGEDVGVVYANGEARTTLRELERGVQEIEIEAAAGTVVYELYFEVDEKVKP